MFLGVSVQNKRRTYFFPVLEQLHCRSWWTYEEDSNKEVTAFCDERLRGINSPQLLALLSFEVRIRQETVCEHVET